jgi:ribosome biogenesis GTPase / thiamine phosphate phosphatase
MGADGLSSLGWDERAARAVAEVMTPGCIAGRVVRVDLDSVVVATEAGDRRARARKLPTVGDWVVADVQEEDAVVVGVARRWSELSRRDPTGRTQVLAANVDLVLVTAPADRLSVARVEREVALGWDSGARPVVLLTKVDLAPAGLAEELRSRIVGVEVVPVSTVAGVGAEDVAEMLRPALTAVLLGPSGAGKSSLANLLLARGAAPIGEVRPGDHRGRHVTSSRGLYAVPTGGVIIDTPGLRSLSLTIDRGGVTAAFPDIETLAADCRFADCQHEHEPDCAVLAAERDGKLDGRRLANYRKLRRELEFELRRDDPTAAREHQRIWKERSKAVRRLRRERGY